MDTDGSTGEVIFTFDGDAAGQKAALRAFALEEKFVTQTYVAVQPDGLDPCDLRVKHGDAAVRDLVARRVPLFEFAIRSVLGQARPGHPRRAVRRDRRGGPDHRQDQGPGQVEAVRGRPGPLDRVHGRALRPRPGPPGRRGHAAQARSTGPFEYSRGGTRAGQQRPGSPRQGQAGRAFDRADPVHRVEREALKLAVQWSGLTGPEFDALGADGVHAARPRGRVRADRRVRRGVNRGPGQGLGGGAARRRRRTTWSAGS